MLVVPIGSELLVALTVPRGGRLLALPKGRLEAGERVEETAVRETREETGLTGALVAPLEEIRYQYRSREWGTRVAKRVAFFLLAYRSGSPAHHDHEVERVRLVPLERAEAALGYPGERRVVAAAVRLLAARASRDGAGREPHARGE